VGLGLPCLAARCGAEEACEGSEQADPWTPGLKWQGCPGKRAFERQDVRAALVVRGMAKMSPLSDWPHGYASWVASTWQQIDMERAKFEDEDRRRRQR